jgi:hypothetical protein
MIGAALLVAWMAVAWPGSAQVVFTGPGLLTSSGQSADVAIVRVLLNTQLKLGLDYKPTAQPADLAGMKTMVVVLGSSTKGLGAAGLDLDREMARTRALIRAARNQGVKVLALHTGGASQRGKMSNDLIGLVVPEADYTVVVAAGNTDHLFNHLAGGRHAPVVEVANRTAVGQAVRAVFK